MKKIKISKLSILLISTILFTLSGCSDDFLNQEPKTELVEEQFYKDFTNVDMAVTSIYSRLCFNGYDVATTISQNVMADDSETGGENAGDGTTYKEMEIFSYTSGNPNLPGLWKVNYKGIRLANTAIKYLLLLPDQNPLVKARLAEAKTLRAYYHFELLKFFGGIPIVKSVLSPTDFYPERSTVADVLHFIQQDLEEAFPDLPLRSALGADLGRVNKGVAQSLLAKAYLFESSYAKNYPGDARFGACENKYANALIMAENVIKSNEYELVGINGQRFPSWWGKNADGLTNKTFDGNINAFRWIFSVAGDNSKESVFEVQNVVDGVGWPNSRGNYLTVFQSCRFTTANPTTMYGWGFNCPSKYLFRAFENSDARETDLAPENKEVIAKNTDPRFFTTVGEEGTQMLVRTGVSAANPLVWASMQLSNVPSHSIGRKYEAHPDQWVTNPASVGSVTGPINWRLIRYSDVVLMAAEAAFETSDKPKAMSYVNMVRKRARNCSDVAGGSIYPKDLTSINFGDIVHERRIELALEQSRWVDLVRWNLTDKYIVGATSETFGGAKVGFVKGKHEFFPIPLTEIQLSNGTLKQYPAWE